MRIAFLPWPTSTCNSNQSEAIFQVVMCRRNPLSRIHRPRRQHCVPSLIPFPNINANRLLPCTNTHNHVQLRKLIAQSQFSQYSRLFHSQSHTTQNNLTSRAETNCKGRRVAFRSCVLLSKSKRAPAIAVSSSEGFCLDGELTAILLIAAMIAGDDDDEATGRG